MSSENRRLKIEKLREFGLFSSKKEFLFPIITNFLQYVDLSSFQYLKENDWFEIVDFDSETIQTLPLKINDDFGLRENRDFDGYESRALSYLVDFYTRNWNTKQPEKENSPVLNIIINTLYHYGVLSLDKNSNEENNINNNSSYDSANCQLGPVFRSGEEYFNRNQQTNSCKKEVKVIVTQNDPKGRNQKTIIFYEKNEKDIVETLKEVKQEFKIEDFKNATFLPFEITIKQNGDAIFGKIVNSYNVIDAFDHIIKEEEEKKQQECCNEENCCNKGKTKIIIRQCSEYTKYQSSDHRIIDEKHFSYDSSFSKLYILKSTREKLFFQEKNSFKILNPKSTFFTIKILNYNDKYNRINYIRYKKTNDVFEALNKCIEEIENRENVKPLKRYKEIYCNCDCENCDYYCDCDCSSNKNNGSKHIDALSS